MNLWVAWIAPCAYLVKDDIFHISLNKKKSQDEVIIPDKIS